jgi:hypothetical protein
MFQTTNQILIGLTTLSDIDVDSLCSASLKVWTFMKGTSQRQQR